jgi:phosphinothricin acetyltransferase
MEISLRRVRESDGNKIIGIFNHYVENSFAAYPVKMVTLSFFDNLRHKTCGTSFYVLEGDHKDVIGFGLLKEHHHSAAFCRTAELAYFIAPDFLHRGLGTTLMDTLIEDAKKMQIKSLLASISSMDPAIMDFHRKKGFEECGRFKKIGMKFDREFDIVWMQKFI